MPTKKNTTGAVFRIDEKDSLAASFSLAAIDQVHQTRDEVWDSPLAFGTLVLVLFVEWLLRKRCRLA
jgi:hypothetical protein